MRLRQASFLFALILSCITYGQEKVMTTPNVTEPSIAEKSASSQVISELYKQIEVLQTGLQDQNSPNQEANLEKLQQLEREFEISVVGKEVVELYTEDEEQSTLEEEFMNILQPFFGAIKETTASLREKEDLRISIEQFSAQSIESSNAVKKIDQYIAEYQGEAPELITKLTELKADYASRAKLAKAKSTTLQQVLDEINAVNTNPMESASAKFTSFLKSTGLHLLIALLVFSLVFFGINYAFKKFMEYSKKNTSASKRFSYEYLATIDGAVFLGSLVLAVLLIPVVFLLCNNWLLISVFLILLIAIFWMVKDKIPDMVEEIRLILNIGAVREQERIIFNDLPWIVDEIKFYSRLINPNLEGGRLRIPLGDLVGMHSRAFKKDEPYFPTEKGDWVLLEDDMVGEVTRQTVETITLKEVGGSMRAITTPAFLEMNPVNLTANGFRSSIIFGIDYKHQATATTEIEQQMAEFIKEKMVAELDDPAHLKDFFIEFAEAGASSLDYEINAEFAGDVASLYKEIGCYLQRFALEACNHYGWEIPFTQIQIHQS